MVDNDEIGDTESADPAGSINTQWVGLAVIVVAIALAVAASQGLAVLEVQTLRALLATGILLLGGREVILVVAERFG